MHGFTLIVRVGVWKCMVFCR